MILSSDTFYGDFSGEVPTNKQAQFEANQKGVSANSKIVDSFKINDTIYSDIPQSLPNLTTTVLTFNNTINNNKYGFLNGSRIELVEQGDYEGIAKFAFGDSGNGYRHIAMRKNGSTTNEVFETKSPVGGIVCSFAMPFKISSDGNDYIEFYAAQSSGGSLDINSTNNYSFRVDIRKI